ncbi:MAG: 3-phosphoshikimate 1-carboxyvinyltransferase [Oscillospiraceae bacterium]
MNVTIAPGPRGGSVRIPASKSQAHRLLILAALGEKECTLLCDGVSKDIAATMECLNALGAEIRRDGPDRLRVRPIEKAPAGLCRLPCGESGSTLRFLLPVAGALGAECVFLREGRLPERPLAPLDRELTAHGMTLREEGALLHCGGQLQSGDYSLPGDVSSQYISGLLMALPRLRGESRLAVTGRRESQGYVAMTEDALRLGGVTLEKSGGEYRIPGGQRPALPAECRVEGDYSNAAFFLCMGALSEDGVTVEGLSPDSSQGDKGVLEILRRFGAEVTETERAVTVRRGRLRGVAIDAAPVPDLIPALSALAAAAEGETRVENAARLRLKESDRLRSTAAMLTALGAEVRELPEGLIIRGRPRLAGGTVRPENDHRIAMAAAVAACACEGAVTVEDSECTAKSYPRFWEDLAALKGETR